MDINDVNYAQKQRLAYIDFKLMFTGSVTRLEVIHRFECGTAAASRDLSLYKDLAPDNLTYSAKDKKYELKNGFKPLFAHDARKTLVKLANDISDGFDAISTVRYPVEAPSSLNVPDLMIVAHISQAIFQNKAVKITYTSLSNGAASREIVPHSIVDNGLRWHVRAFDRKSKEFRDFVITRITKATVIPGVLNEPETKVFDEHWNQLVLLKIVPHPQNIKHSTAIELDYQMVKGKLEIKSRAALTGYLLRRWNVDCSNDASLTGGEHHLWLSNVAALPKIRSMAIAPGYKV